jgi:hypothetical protein
MGPPHARGLAARPVAGKVGLVAVSALGQQPCMDLQSRLRERIKSARKRQAAWVNVLDTGRLLVTAEGRARLWTRVAHGSELHQTTPQTAEDRYPELFDFVARLFPSAGRLLSFGCSTGEELAALRQRFPEADIVGAEINSRSRQIATRRFAGDPRVKVVPPNAIGGDFDIVLAMAVFQREPVKIAEMDVLDLTPFYPFARFDSAVADLTGWLRPGGLLCVANAHYRVEDSRAAGQLEPVPGMPSYSGDLFGPDGTRLRSGRAASLFRKRGSETWRG